jgi:hypothetical protein
MFCLVIFENKVENKLLPNMDIVGPTQWPVSWRLPMARDGGEHIPEPPRACLAYGHVHGPIDRPTPVQVRSPCLHVCMEACSNCGPASVPVLVIYLYDQLRGGQQV